MNTAYIISGYRSAVGKSGKGVFKFTRPDDLAANVVRHLVASVPELDKDKIDDVTKVLISLGYKRSAINQVIKKLVSKENGIDENIEDIIKEALKLL